MRTIVCNQPGSLSLGEQDYPQERSGHTILRIRNIGICGTDLHAYEGTQPYFSYPRILGHELAGEIVQTGASGFNPGDLVTVIPYLSCGNCIACRTGKPNCCVQIEVCGVHTDGGMREYFSVPDSILIDSRGLSLEALALVEPLAIGAHGVRRAGITEKEPVLVIGAGPIGLGTVEFAKIAGGEVIVMDVNETRLEFCRNKLGVRHTINPKVENPSEKLRSITNGDMASVVIDATGSQQAILNGFSFLAHGGRYVLIGLQKGEISFSHPEFHKREATLMSSRNALKSDFQQVIDCLVSGKINPLHFITHRIPFMELPEKFPGLLDPASMVIKAMVSVD